VHPEDRPLVQREYRERIAGTEATSFQLGYRVVRPDGAVRSIEKIIDVLRDDTGRPLRAVGAAQDVTERKQAERAVRTSERILREAEELGHTGSWEHDLVTGEIVNTDENLRLFFGPDRNKGAHFEDFAAVLHPDDRDYVIRRREQLLAETGPPDIEYRVVWPDGSVHVIRGLATVVRDAAGRPLRVHGTNVDVTVQRATEAALRTAADQLQQLSRRLLKVQEEERRHLARELHDEFGQLIASVTLLLRAARGAAGDAARARLDECTTLLQRAGEQVRGLALELRPPMLETLGLEETLRWLAEQHQQRTGIPTTVVGHLNDVPPDLSVVAFRVAQEALTNVTRHAQARHIWIELTQADGRLLLVVRDDGMGFDVARTVAQAPASGHLGLLGMRERVQILGGTLEVLSQPGQGTRIRVTLPQ
jgi:two-component system sensor histidine kinase UhpB